MSHHRDDVTLQDGGRVRSSICWQYLSTRSFVLCVNDVQPLRSSLVNEEHNGRRFATASSLSLEQPPMSSSLKGALRAALCCFRNN
mmetsp:Transcript_35209/g.110024  ORF Transcript_35209/g.110024 Transcript_35209/m.110024 type:complete len:86 (-) Transcript_35209:813-1070(-)